MENEREKGKEEKIIESQNSKTNKIYLEFGGHWFSTSIEGITSINSIWHLPPEFDRYIP